MKMGRHTNAHREELRRAKELQNLHEDESDFETSTLQNMHRLHKEKAKAKASSKVIVSKKKVVPKKVVIESEDSEDNDNTKLTPAQRKEENKKKASRLTIINLVDKLANALADVADPEDAKAHLTEDGTIDPETISELKKNCMVLKDKLKHLGSIVDTPAPNVAIPSTSSHYGKYMVYRPPDQKLLYLLSVAEVFRPDHIAYTNRKTLGFVREKGTQFPMMCALSGWTNVLEEHPRLLNTEIWLDEVKDFALTHLDHVFKTGSWDRAKKRDDGDGHASHVEPALMLWYAYHLVGRNYGKQPSMEKTGRWVWQLRNLKKNFEAVIVISKHPCKECRKFQKIFQKHSAVTFKFDIVDNLGEVFTERDAKGYEIYPRYAVDDDISEEIEEGLRMMIEYGGATPRKTGSKITVETPSETESPKPRVYRPKAKVKPTPQVQAPDWHHQHSEKSSAVKNNQQEEVRRSSPMYSVVTTKTVQKRRIQSFTYEDPNKSIILDDSESDEYVPDTQISTLKAYSSQPKTTPRRGPSYAPLTPDSGPFSLEARQRAQEIHNNNNKKRRLASESGPSSKASKKQRWNHPDYRLAE